VNLDAAHSGACLETSRVMRRDGSVRGDDPTIASR
jgi:hypothetical protein